MRLPRTTRSIVLRCGTLEGIEVGPRTLTLLCSASFQNGGEKNASLETVAP